MCYAAISAQQDSKAGIVMAILFEVVLVSDVGWLLANVATNENKTVFTDLDCIRELLPERAWK